MTAKRPEKNDITYFAIYSQEDYETLILHQSDWQEKNCGENEEIESHHNSFLVG